MFVLFMTSEALREDSYGTRVIPGGNRQFIRYSSNDACNEILCSKYKIMNGRIEELMIGIFVTQLNRTS